MFSTLEARELETSKSLTELQLKIDTAKNQSYSVDLSIPTCATLQNNGGSGFCRIKDYVFERLVFENFDVGWRTESGHIWMANTIENYTSGSIDSIDDASDG
jgi:hypothetical protein